MRGGVTPGEQLGPRRQTLRPTERKCAAPRLCALTKGSVGSETLPGTAAPEVTRPPSISKRATTVTAVAPLPGHEKLHTKVTLAVALAGHTGMHDPLAAPVPVPVVLTHACVMAPPRGDVTLSVPVMGLYASGSEIFVRL